MHSMRSSVYRATSGMCCPSLPAPCLGYAVVKLAGLACVDWRPLPALSRLRCDPPTVQAEAWAGIPFDPKPTPSRLERELGFPDFRCGAGMEPGLAFECIGDVWLGWGWWWGVERAGCPPMWPP